MQPKTETIEQNRYDTVSLKAVRTQSVLDTRWLMPLVDVLLTLAAFGLAYFVRYELQVFRPVFELNAAPFVPYLPYYVLYTLWMLFNYRGAGLYRHVRGRAWLEEVYIIINGATNATLVTMAVSFFLRPIVFSRLMLVYVAALTVILLAISRVVLRLLRSHLRSKGVGIQRVLLVGAGESGQAVLRTMIARKELGYAPVGYLDDDPERGSVDLGRVKGLGKIDNLLPVIEQHPVDLVVITLDWQNRGRILSLVNVCLERGIQTQVVPDVFQLNMRQVQVENLNGIPLLGLKSAAEFQPFNRYLKRATDLILIILASPLLLLLFAITTMAISLEGPGPIIYSQERVGEKGRRFKMLKFRSMIPNADQYRQELVAEHELDPRHPKIPNDPRITRVGRFIRKASLDELPNIINVIRGEMSLVGPRPPTPDEVNLYEPWHRQRLNIMPGITGMWQVSGRSDVPFEEMCLLDIYYIENWSVKLDLQIILMTIPRVLLRHGAY